MATSSSAISSNTEIEDITFMDSRLYWGAAEGKIDIFKEDRALQLDQILTPGKNSVLHLHITASLTGDIDFVNEILGICPQLLMQPNEYGDIPLHTAARYGHIKIVKLLIGCAKALDREEDCDLESGTDSTAVGGVVAKEMLRKKNKENDTSLHEAVRFGHLGVVRILTSEDPDYLYDANGSGETPLYMAAERGYGDVVREILSNCSSVAAGGPNYRTALHATIIAKKKEITKIVLQKMEHLTKERDDKGWVPLHYAADMNNLWIVQMLLNYNKKAAYLKDKEGRTPLHIAASRGYYKILKRIILMCPDCCEVMDNKGWNVLHYLVQRRVNYMYSVKFILNTSALSYLLNAKDNAGNTPLHMIMGTSAIAKRLLAHPRLDKMAYNKQNQNALDVDSTSTGRVFGKRIFRWRLRKVGLRSSRRIMLTPSEDGERLDRDQNKKIYLNASRKEKAIEGSLIVGTLIATVTFTAGFTLPGGFVTDNGPLQGTAILRRNKSFQAFVITDMIAFVLSSIAVLSLLFMLLTNKNKYVATLLFERSVQLILWAMAAMVIALITAMFVVLEPSLVLAIVICMIGSSFFCFFPRAISMLNRVYRFGLSTF